MAWTITGRSLTAEAGVQCQVYVELLVDNVGVRTVSLQVPRFSPISIIPTFLHTHTFIYTHKHEHEHDVAFS
jgi:hypothetical protein